MAKAQSQNDLQELKQMSKAQKTAKRLRRMKVHQVAVTCIVTPLLKFYSKRVLSLQIRTFWREGGKQREGRREEREREREREKEEREHTKFKQAKKLGTKIQNQNVEARRGSKQNQWQRTDKRMTAKELRGVRNCCTYREGLCNFPVYVGENIPCI
jgi:hypothetical protein